MRIREGLQLIGFRVPGGAVKERDWRVLIRGATILDGWAAAVSGSGNLLRSDDGDERVRRGAAVSGGKETK